MNIEFYEKKIFPSIDASWTLFLDRDGVINRKRDHDYVKSISELELLPGALEAIEFFSKLFGKIVIVTNQQGIGKGIMSISDLDKVHEHLIKEITKAKGNIDAIYYAPQLAKENSNMRKPEIGMALKAKKEFPQIVFEKSIIIGDSPSDMEFGKNANIFPLFITGNTEYTNPVYRISSLQQFHHLLRDKFSINQSSPNKDSI